MNRLRLILAVVWTLAWGTLRWLAFESRLPGNYRPWNCRLAGFSWGRHDSPKAVRCPECGWTGPLRWTIHTYADDHMGDVEPVDECPKCGHQELDPVVWNRKKGWGS